MSPGPNRSLWSRTSKHVDEDVLLFDRSACARLRDRKGTHHAQEIPRYEEGERPPDAAAIGIWVTSRGVGAPRIHQRTEKRQRTARLEPIRPTSRAYIDSTPP